MDTLYYYFEVPYHHAEDECEPQALAIYPEPDLGFVLQFLHNGKPHGSIAYPNIEAAVIAARHVMGICCVQGDPDKIRSYIANLQE